MNTLLRTAFISLFILSGIVKLQAQTCPYALSPKWVFGDNAMFDFTGITLSQPAVTSGISGAEGTSTLCDSLKNVAICTDNFRVAGNNLTSVGTMTSSRSSTGGGVIFPNPANPYAQFFIVAGNAEVAGPGETAGADIRLYRSNKSGATVTAPTQLGILGTNAAGYKENVYVSVDGDWGYHIISAYAPSGANTFSAWKVDKTGAFSTTPSSSSTGGTQWNPQYQGTIKVSRCQNKIALVYGSIIEVRDWDRISGTAGTQRYFNNTAPSSKYYGAEFSPNGNYLYVTTLSPSQLIKVDVVNGTQSLMASNATGTLQLAPNGVIYVSNGNDASTSTNIGTITNPDTPGATYNANGVTLTSGQKYLGMSNIAYINPRKPSISYSLGSCSYTFTPGFLTYFKDPVSYNKAVWDFGDGTALVTNNGTAADDPVVHPFSSLGNKTITLTLTDAVCGHEFENTYVLNVSCALPVELISFTGIAENGSVRLNWSTATEINNSHFEVQRSVDGTNFVTIDRVEGRGNSHSISYYSYLDKSPEGDKIYYRLIQHDFDGKSESSNVIAVHMDGLQLVVSPNPSGTEFNVNIANAESGTISVLSLLGTEVFSAQTSAAASTFTFGKELSKGYYILKYTSGAESKSYKLEKL